MINLKNLPNGCMVQLRHGGNYLRVSSIYSIDDGFFDVSFDNGATHKTYLATGNVFFDRQSDFDITNILLEHRYTFNKHSEQPYKPDFKFR